MTNILVVDDEHDVQYLFKQYFRRQVKKGEITFHFALSAEDALEKLTHIATDLMLVLSDINMPGMTGLELLRIVKARFPRLRVVMITAYNDNDNRETALAHGADGYLTKPIDFLELQQTFAQFKVL